MYSLIICIYDWLRISEPSLARGFLAINQNPHSAHFWIILMPFQLTSYKQQRPNTSSENNSCILEIVYVKFLANKIVLWRDRLALNYANSHYIKQVTCTRNGFFPQPANSAPQKYPSYFSNSQFKEQNLSESEFVEIPRFLEHMIALIVANIFKNFLPTLIPWLKY